MDSILRRMQRDDRNRYHFAPNEFVVRIHPRWVVRTKKRETPVRESPWLYYRSTSCGDYPRRVVEWKEWSDWYSRSHPYKAKAHPREGVSLARER